MKFRFLFVALYIVISGVFVFNFKLNIDKEYISLKENFVWLDRETYILLKRNCSYYSIDINLMCSVIQYESGNYCGNNLVRMKQVRSHKNAIGLCQIHWVHNPENPDIFLSVDVNIKKGCMLYRQALDKAIGNDYENPIIEANRFYNAGLGSKRYKYKNWNNYAKPIYNLYVKTKKKDKDDSTFIAILE